MMFGEVDGGKGYSGEGNNRTGWVISNATYRCSTCPPKRKTMDDGSEEAGCMVQTGRGSGRAVNMKRWFVTKKEQVAKRRALEVQTAQQSTTSRKPRPGRGRKRSRDEEGVATAAINWLGRFKRVKEAAETWHWPPF